MFGSLQSWNSKLNNLTEFSTGFIYSRAEESERLQFLQKSMITVLISNYLLIKLCIVELINLNRFLNKHKQVKKFLCLLMGTPIWWRPGAMAPVAHA